MDMCIRTLGWFVGVSLLLSSCLLPPPMQGETYSDNHPPRVLIDSLVPHPTTGPLKLSANCPPHQFHAIVTDPDQGDAIYWRVFIDYHRDDEPLQTEVRTLEFDPAQQEQRQSLNFDIDPRDERFDKGGGVNATHTVELLISDRPFNNQGVFPVGRSVDAEEGFLDSSVWPVPLEASNDDCPDESQCRQGLSA